MGVYRRRGLGERRWRVILGFLKTMKGAVRRAGWKTVVVTQEFYRGEKVDRPRPLYNVHGIDSGGGIELGTSPLFHPSLPCKE